MKWLKSRKSTVALYTSAWIEIPQTGVRTGRWPRRTLHECVDWNDWQRAVLGGLSVSHSTRVRGLKYVTDHDTVEVKTSHSTRVRGLKFRNKRWYCAVEMSHSTRVRGLKFHESGRRQPESGRTLHECVDWNGSGNCRCIVRICRTLHECVDWNDVNEELIDILPGVALYTSAWIEIIQNK